MYGYICGKAVRTNWTSCETILAEILGILHTTHVSMLLPFNTFAKTKTCRWATIRASTYKIRKLKVTFNISSVAVCKLLLIGDHRKDWALCLMAAEHMHSSSFA